MRNIMFYLVLLMVIAACGSNQENVASTTYKPIFVNYTSTDVKNAAKTGLSSFVGSLGSRYADFGFLSQEELVSAQVGNPYHVFSMTNTGKIDQTIGDIGQWSFPVMVNNEYRCMLNVGKVNNEWRAIRVGSVQLATWLQALEKSHPTLSINAKGLVNIYERDTTIVMANPSDQQPSFYLLPYSTDLLRNLPQYSTWAKTDPVPDLSFRDLFLIYGGLP